MKKYDYLIVGSGITGAIFAYEARKHGKKCFVLEKRGHTGGNLYCESVANINVHKYGAHIFHTSDKKVWDYMNQFTEFNHYRNSPVANFKGEIYNLPFNMNTFSKLWGISTPEQAEAIIKAQRNEIIGEPKNLEEQAVSMVGRDVFEKLIKGYTKKQWGKTCAELPPNIIKRLPVRFTYDNNYFDDVYQGIPIGGYNAVIDKLFTDCDIELNADYNKNRTKYNQMAEKIVYTGMIDEYFDYELGQLEYRSLRFETELLNKENHQGVAVVNYTDSETQYTRVIEHKHFEFGKQPQTVITKEYSSAWEQGMEAYYPVNDVKNQELFLRYKELADREKNVVFCGRLGEYKYYDIDDAISAVLAITEREFV